MNTDQLLRRFREVMPVNEMADPVKLKVYNDEINEFTRECGEFIQHLRKFKKQIKLIVPIKEQELAHYKGFVDFLVKYEELNVKKAKENMAFTANILVGENKVDLKDKLTSTA